MNKLSINLSPRYRLDLCLVKRRRGESLTEPIIPSFSKIRRVRRGNKISRFFRHIFEHKRTRSILGTNLALFAMASSVFPASGIAVAETQNSIVTVEDKINFETQRGLIFPVESVVISQGYHFFHQAIDFDGKTGDPIFSIMRGEVLEIQYSRFAYGNAVLISHGNGLVSLYAHLSRIEVERDQRVEMGTKIGEIGATGRAFGDHLHFELRKDGKNINPLTVLPEIEK